MKQELVPPWGRSSVYFLKARTVVLGMVALLAIAFGVGWLAGTRNPEGVPVSLHMPVARGLDMPMFYVRTERPQVALTFDISWGRETAIPVLDVLQDKNVKATFFLTGFWAKRHTDIAQRIVRDGHEIASHGDAHVNLSRYDGDAIAKNIMTAHRDLEEATGRQARFFRPPNGDYDDLVVATARQLGYETVIWSLDTIDWKNPGPDFMIRQRPRERIPGRHHLDARQRLLQANSPGAAANYRRSPRRRFRAGDAGRNAAKRHTRPRRPARPAPRRGTMMGDGGRVDARPEPASLQ